MWAARSIFLYRRLQAFSAACSRRKFCSLPAPPSGTVYTVVGTSQTLAGLGASLYGWEKAESGQVSCPRSQTWRPSGERSSSRIQKPASRPPQRPAVRNSATLSKAQPLSGDRQAFLVWTVVF